MEVTVVIPTYNEGESIGRLIEALESEFEAMPGDCFKILVVDSNSPDGTSGVVRQAMQCFDNVRLLTGEKRGLGFDTARGFCYAIEKLRAEVVVSMDGDFSHDPADVRRLLERLAQGADYVIGSRYVKGGSMPADWGWDRKLMSLVGNVVARFLGVGEVRDQTPNFRAIRVSGVLDKIDLETLPKGYSFQIALICAAHDIGAKFAEVPIHFRNREKGQSKLPKNYILEALGFLLRYRLGKVFGI